MCGISGVIGAIDSADVARCERMNERLRHRGPDDSGIWTWQLGAPFGAVLGHRRLAIIDLRTIAAQPMIDEDSGTTLVFNGEIYNFRQLRAELAAAGTKFITEGDSEVILKGYARWGTDLFARLRGMFALVLVDPQARRALLARDGYGIKPLYYSRPLGKNRRASLAFASETRALVDAGYARRQTDGHRIGQVLWNGFMPGPHTIWTDIAEVPRGCFAILDEDGTLQWKRFWSISSALAPAAPIQLDEADHLLAESAKLHLTADVAKVVFLSGGVDSTAVAAAAAAQVEELHTLSIAFAEADADERQFASAAAAAIGSHHHVVEMSAASVLEEMDKAVEALDQPSFDGINSWFVSREAVRLGFKVALSGAGGDELAGGYTSFRRGLWADRFMAVPGSAAAARFAGRELERVLPESKVGQLGRAFGAAEQMYQSQYAMFSRATIRGLMLDSDAPSPWGLNEQRRSELAADIAPLSTLRAVTALESEMFLGDRLLRDIDSVSMAHSLEVRVPFVDTFLADGLAGLGDADRYLPIGKKRLLRRQSRLKMPSGFFDRPKRGFEFPLDNWMRGPLRPMIEATLLDSGQCAALGLRATKVADLWHTFLERPGALYWTRLWTLFALMRWAQTNQAHCG